MPGTPRLDGRVVACIWNDAHYSTDESDASDVTHRPWIYTTVGILVKSDNTGLTIAQDEGEDGKYRSRTFIPRGMIMQEWDIGLVRPKQKRKRKALPEAITSI